MRGPEDAPSPATGAPHASVWDRLLGPLFSGGRSAANGAERDVTAYHVHVVEP